MERPILKHGRVLRVGDESTYFINVSAQHDDARRQADARSDGVMSSGAQQVDTAQLEEL